jgi:hypothetical protein
VADPAIPVAAARPAWLTPTPQNLLIASVALVAVIAVVAFTVVAGSHKASPNQVTSTGPEVTTSQAQIAQAAVEALSQYVERARGLKFLHPVKATLYSDADFNAHLKALGSGRVDGVDVAARVATLEALGMLPPNFDINKDQVSDTSGVLGYYDPFTKELAIRGSDISVYTSKTIVHELTHALQDQHFDLRRLLGSPNADMDLAYRSLFEGDARRIEEGWVSTLSLEEQDLLERQARQNGDEEFPAGYLLGFTNFPYVVGSRFDNSLIAAGGQSLLDAAFANPPTSSKQIIQPPAFISHDNPVPVIPPAADGTVVDHGVIGEFELIYVLAQDMSGSAAAVFSSGWAGSSYVTWQGAKSPCTRIRLATEGPIGATGMLVALQSWAQGGNRTIQGTNPITITACA